MNAVIQLFKSVLEISLFASAMIVVVLLIRAAAKDKINIKAVSILWFLVVLRLCIPGMLESPVHVDALFPAPAETQQTAGQPVAQNDAANFYENNAANHSLTGNEAAAPLESSGQNQAAASEPHTAAFYEQALAFIRSIDLWLAASILWMTGGAIVLASALRESISFYRRIRRSSRTLDDKGILDIVAAHKEANRLRRTIRVSVCSSIQMPLAFGVLHPQILLPADMTEELSKEHIDDIVLHEVCHIKRNDILKSYACVLAKALHWFNPLVWIGLKIIKDDMEYACDQRVLKLVKAGREVKYCESLLVATRFMKQRRIPQFAASLCESRSNLKERIVKMIKPAKKSRSAVVISMALAMIMLVACFTTACQPTPEESVVAGKNNDNLDSIIAGTPAPTIDTETVQQNETWQEQLSENNVMVNIDAEITLPQVAQFPVVEAGPKLYTEDDAWKIIRVFFKDATVYDDPIFTKEVLEAQIITLKKELSDIQSGAIDGDADSINDQIEYYSKLLQNAPSENEGTQALDHLSFEEQNGRKVVKVSANIGNNGSPATLMIANDESAFQTCIYFSNLPDGFSTSSIAAENNMEMTLDEAVSKAQNTMRDLGAEDMVLAEACTVGSAEEQAYELKFIKSVNGIGITDYQSHTMTQPEGEDSVYAPTLKSEQVIIYINDGGILQFFLSSPLEMENVINDNVEILSVDKVKDIFRDQVFYNYYASDDRPLTINVDRIALSYFIQSVKDRQGAFRVIPVWDFLSSGNAAEGDSYTYSVLTINAIDGSIVDRNLGY